jgi:O-antigen/teichoic acid export membrane protein
VQGVGFDEVDNTGYVPMSARYYLGLIFNQVQPANHSQRRYQRIAQGALAALASKGIGFLVSLISVPLTLGYLGAERYGVWVTISTLLAWLSIVDLGLGNGLLNALSEAYGKERQDLARQYISTAFLGLCGVAISAGLLIGLTGSGSIGAIF